MSHAFQAKDQLMSGITLPADMVFLPGDDMPGPEHGVEDTRMGSRRGVVERDGEPVLLPGGGHGWKLQGCR